MQCFIKQLQVPSLIPSGPLETCVSPGAAAQNCISSPFQVPMLPGCAASMEVGHPRVASTDQPSNNLRVQLQAGP